MTTTNALSILAFAAPGLVCLLTSCGGDTAGAAATRASTTDAGAPTRPGSEGGPCSPNGACNAGLTCASRLCVSLPGASGGAGAGRGGGAGSLNGSGGVARGGAGNGGIGNGGMGNGGEPDASVGDGGAGGMGGGGTGGGGMGGGGTGGGACAAIMTKPEQVIVYVDAAVTDTVTTYSPVALYVMLERSTRMNTGIGGGNPLSFAYATDALQAFVTDPASGALDIGLGVFPPISNGAGSCDGSDCGQPLVSIGPVPTNGAAIVAGMQQATPTANPLLLTPTECALRGMITQCLQYQAQSGEPCVSILVTDGAPTTCDTNNANLVAIVADGKSRGVTTFALGLQGADLNFLNQLAVVGGTAAATDVSSGSAAFIAALNVIRVKVSRTSTHVVTTPRVIATTLPCEWKIPPPPSGAQFQKDKVNVVFTPAGGAATRLGYVGVADCGRAVDAWYYDDPANPTAVLLCPQACDKVKASPGSELDLAFGCATNPAVLR